MLLLSFSVFSQNIVDGKVVDSGTELGLQNVKVSVLPIATEVFSDENGNFSIELPLGKYVFSFLLDGYVEKRMEVEVSQLKVTLPNILLESDFSEDSSHMVVISESELEDDENGADMVSGLLQSSRDIFLRRVAYDLSSAFFKPRGYDSKEATVLLNGIPMNRIENGRVQWSN